MSDAIHFDHPPLDEVVCGVHFAGVKWSDIHWGLFYAKVRGRYPHTQHRPPCIFIRKRCMRRAANRTDDGEIDDTTWLFPLYVKARGSLRSRIYDVLLHFKEPDTILTTALAEYQKYGNEERLVLAASLVADIGTDALPALRVLARSRSPECEIFVTVIANLRGIRLEERLEVLAEFASNPGSDVRYSLLEALRALPTDAIMPLLTTLSTDADEEIASKAQAWLDALEI
jgi:hypothetical protein